MKYDAITAAAIELLAGDSTIRQTVRGKALANAIEAKHPMAVPRARARIQAQRLEARFVGDPPEWAKRLIIKHFPDFPRLVWRRSRVHAFSSGRCFADHIVLTAGWQASEDDLRVVLLHEIAHRRGHGHDARYYREFHRLLVAEHLYRHAFGMLYRWDGGLRRAAREARAAS